MIETIQPFVDAMRGDQGWVLQISAWVVAFRTVFKPFSAQLETFLARAVQWVRESPESDDDLLLQRLLSNRLYRLLVFVVDFGASIKLPTVATLKQ